LLLAYLQLICCERRSFIDALENKGFQVQIPVELQRQWSSKGLFLRTKKLR
jgi:hypothetical protein